MTQSISKENRAMGFKTGKQLIIPPKKDILLKCKKKKKSKSENLCKCVVLIYITINIKQVMSRIIHK